jgi:hypothetical protein
VPCFDAHSHHAVKTRSSALPFCNVKTLHECPPHDIGLCSTSHDELLNTCGRVHLCLVTRTPRDEPHAARKGCAWMRCSKGADEEWRAELTLPSFGSTAAIALLGSFDLATFVARRSFDMGVACACAGTGADGAGVGGAPGCTSGMASGLAPLLIARATSGLSAATCRRSSSLPLVS